MESPKTQTPSKLAPKHPLGNLFTSILIVAFICALLLPQPAPTPYMGFIRHTAVMTVCATGLASNLSVIVLHNTGKTNELGYICVPLGLASGAITAAYYLGPCLWS